MTASMQLPRFTMRQLLEAGAHYGHRTSRWNPKMEPYIFGVRQGVHILDLRKTVPLLHQAMSFVAQVVQNHGRVLFVGTTPHASSIVAEQAKRCGQYYVNRRWLGGMLTNWETISKLIRTLDDLEKKLNPENRAMTAHYTKKEWSQLQRHYQKLMHSIGGIRSMGGRPDVMVVLDTNKEELALTEARKLNIPVVAIVDSNSNPDKIAYPIPGNDDSVRSVTCLTQLIADAALVGLQHGLAASGIHIGDVMDHGLTSEDAAYEASLSEMSGDLTSSNADASPASSGESPHTAERVSSIEGIAPFVPTRDQHDGPIALIVPKAKPSSRSPHATEEDKAGKKRGGPRNAASENAGKTDDKGDGPKRHSRGGKSRSDGRKPTGSSRGSGDSVAKTTVDSSNVAGSSVETDA